jgi:hypothetical protein
VQTQNKECGGHSFEAHESNHKHNFADPATSMHTQNVQWIWELSKWHNKEHQGTTSHLQEYYLAKFIGIINSTRRILSTSFWKQSTNIGSQKTKCNFQWCMLNFRFPQQ